ncbi:two-partner secretion domain-containing protein [Peristeroidobacter agariperforans]|uniref:two-partner secretion domain-containing protein n=1 Tax=Peristeroidobacter agariperforans TaxID=268404 RepID=UPI00101D8E2D|nr:filamentous hemagglutinin N-terminal domain-containing protein [Peristeroidobacter agariperforans]
MSIIKNKRRTAVPKRPLNGVLSSFVVAGFSSAALANPQGATIVEGSATITQSSASQLDVISTTDRAIINWNSFSIGSGELTRFQMGSSDSAVLNRVIGGTISQIDGSLTSNGRVYLINPNGVIIGATGMVQTQSFIASTRYLADEDFMNGGEMTFLGTGSGEVHNLGTIVASDGDVALIGDRVVNSGSISAPQGVIALAAGDDIMLAAPGSSRLLVRVAGVTDADAAQIQHTGDLSAAQAELQAVGGNLYALAVNAAGAITATGVQNRGGRIYLTGNAAQINVTGTLTARNSDGAGGSIHIDSGVGYESEARVTGTLNASSTSTGGSINIDSSRIELNDGARLLVSGGSGNAGGVFVGSEEDTNQVIVAEGASIEANSLSGDAGNIELSGAGVYFHGELHARGGASQAQFNIHSGEGVEYTGLADLRAYGDEARFGSVNIDSAYSNLRIAPTDGILPVLDSDALATQLNYGNVKIAANGAGRYIDVFAPLSWQAATRLTLQADDTVDINQAIDGSNGALHLISLNAAVTDLEPATITVRDLWLSAAEQVNLANRVVAQNVTLYDIGGPTWLTNEQNQLGSITFMRDLRAQSGEVDIVDSAGGLSLTTSNVGGIGYSTYGNFRVRTSGNLTLAPEFHTQVGGDVTLVAAGGVLRNQSTAGANVFGTSSTGLGRTRVYASAVGDNGGLEGAAQYNVSYSAEHETAASTGFYYSGSAPQEPGPSDPGPVDPVDPEEPVDPPDPVDPPVIPEPPPLPPSQIIQTALDGNSFEQLSRPSPDDFSRLAANLGVLTPPLPPGDPANWSTGKTDQLEALAELADVKGTNTSKRPIGAPENQPPPERLEQRVLDQIEDMVARLSAFLQAVQSAPGKETAGMSSAQISQLLKSMSPEVLQLLGQQSPHILEQQLAIIMAKLAMEQRNRALDERLAARDQALQELQEKANDMRESAQQLYSGAITSLVMSVVQAATQIAASQAGAVKTPVLRDLNLPQKPDDTKFSAPTPPQLPQHMPPVSLPSAVQARLDALRALEALQNRP